MFDLAISGPEPGYDNTVVVIGDYYTCIVNSLTATCLSFILILFFCCSLQLFQRLDQFRVFVFGGDGSIGWVLSTIDKLHLHSKVSNNRLL